MDSSADVMKQRPQSVSTLMVISIPFVCSSCATLFLATIRKPLTEVRKHLANFGEYVAACLPKYVQKSQLTKTDELELLIHRDGVIPVITFLKDHHNAQFVNVADICGMDVPARPSRFEVSSDIWLHS